MFDLKTLNREHERVLFTIDNTVNLSMEIAGQQAEKHVKNFAPFRRRSQKSAKDATTHRVIRTRGGKLLVIENPKKHAKYLEDGTPDHEVKATNRKALRFYNPYGSGFMYRRRVKVKGIKATKFLYKATVNGFQILVYEIETRLKSAFARS